MSYGSAKTRAVAAGFDEVNLSGNYTDFKMYMDQNVNATLDLASTYAGIKIPSTNVNKTFDAQDGNSHEVKATIGRGGGLLKARLKYGAITVARN